MSHPFANAIPVAETSQSERALFIQRTYTHLALAILGFILLETVLLNMGQATTNLVSMMIGGRYSWFIVLGAFMFVSYIAESWATSGVTREKQYLGLGLYVVAEAIIFLPILFIAANYSSPQVIPAAGITTLALFGGLTFIAFTSKTDFSFLGGILKVASFIAMGVIIASMIMGFNLGILFAGAMAVFAGGCILYQTSSILHHYPTDQYVAASLSLFASVALLFWYILRIFMASDD